MATIHATAVLIGSKAALIRGPSGSGKSRLALELLRLADLHQAFARLVADDRVALTTAGGRLLASPPAALAGLIERRGEGIVAVRHEAIAVVGLVVDLAAPDAARMPDADGLSISLSGVTLPRLPVAAGTDAAPLILARCPWRDSANAVLAAAHPRQYRG